MAALLVDLLVDAVLESIGSGLTCSLMNGWWGCSPGEDPGSGSGLVPHSESCFQAFERERLMEMSQEKNMH